MGDWEIDSSISLDLADSFEEESISQSDLDEELSSDGDSVDSESSSTTHDDSEGTLGFRTWATKEKKRKEKNLQQKVNRVEEHTSKQIVESIEIGKQKIC